MIQLWCEWFEKFAYMTGILGRIRVYQEHAFVIWLIIGVISCFFGFRLYRGLFSVIVFMGVTIASCFLLRERTDWGSVVACFSVVGCVLAFLAYNWYRMGACILNSLICMSFAWLIMPTWWSVGIGAIIGVMSTLIFPVISICSFTALWGSILISEWMGKPHMSITFLLLAGVGVVFQLFTNRKQTLFTKVCPEQLTCWLEQHKKRRG